MALNAKQKQDTTLNVETEERDNDGSERQNWKCDEDGFERRYWEVMALNAKTEKWW